MDKTIRLKKILKFLTENPLVTIREIADNSSETRINYKIAIKLTNELVKQKRISDLFGYYYAIPMIDKEISFLVKITDNDRILKPKFKKLHYKIESEKSFHKILEQYISLLHFQIKIKKTQANIDKKPYSSNKAIKQIRFELKKYLKSFEIPKEFNGNNPHGFLFKYIVDKYFYDKIHYDEVRTHGRSIGEKLDMLSTLFSKNNIREITDNYGYKSNKFPHRMINDMFHPNGNLKLERFYPAITSGRISNEEVSKIFVQWMLRLNASRLRTKKDQKKFSDIIKKQYKGWDILKQGDFKSFDIS